MNNNNFTAQEIKSLQLTAVNVFKEIVEAIKAVETACSDMSGIVASGDSNLSGRWSAIADSIAGPVATAVNSFDFIGDALNSYVAQTISNEQSAESDLGSIDAEIGALGNIANSLVDLGSLSNGTVAAPVSGAAATAGGVAAPVSGAAATVGGAAATVGQSAGGVGSAVTGGNGPIVSGNGVVVEGSAFHDMPPAIYAPPTLTYVEAQPIDTGTHPSVIYAPPTPSPSIGKNE